MALAAARVASIANRPTHSAAPTHASHAGQPDSNAAHSDTPAPAHADAGPALTILLRSVDSWLDGFGPGRVGQDLLRIVVIPSASFLVLPELVCSKEQNYGNR